MKKITDFLGKPVLSLYESTTQGIIKDCLFDKNFKKLKYLVLFEDGELQEEKILNVANIYSLGENAIIIRNSMELKDSSVLCNETSNAINNSAYNTNGKFLGVVSDLIIQDNFNIEKVILSNGVEIENNLILNSGKDIIMIKDENSSIKLCNFKSKTTINNKETYNKIKVQIMKPEQSAKPEQISQTETLQNLSIGQTETLQSNQDIQSQSNNSTIISTENTQTNNTLSLSEKQSKKQRTILTEDCLPTISTTKVNFLIGRKVSKNIYSFNHELIIKKNTRINEKIILLAKTHSKFKELSLYSA